MASLRLTGAALALLSLSAAPAAASGLSLPKATKDAWAACHPHAVKLKASDAATLVYEVPASGGTGLFLAKRWSIQNHLGTGEAIKFTAFPQYGVEAARKLLTAMDLPHDTLMGTSVDPKQIEASIARLYAARAQRKFHREIPAVANQPTAAEQAAHQRINLVMSRLGPDPAAQQPVGAAPPLRPAYMITTAIVGRVARAEVFGSMLYANDPQDLRPLPERIDDLALAMQALAAPHNQQFLGALYLTDLVMGNGDRLSRVTGPNWNNLQLGAGQGGGPPCLVAIDNDAVAPPPIQVLFNVALQGRTAPAQANQLAWTYPPGFYFDQIVGEFDDRHGVPTPGPRRAFNEAPGQAAAPAGRCSPVPPQRHALAAAQLDLLRHDINRLIVQSAAWLRQAPQSQTIAVGDPYATGACQSSLVATGSGGPLTVTVDWTVFETNFQAGFDAALQYFIGQKDSFYEGVARLNGKEDGVDRTSREGLLARVEFLRAVASPYGAQMTLDQLRGAIIHPPAGRRPAAHQQGFAHTFQTIGPYPPWGNVMLFD